ncbi:MAG: TlpA disulfide reductase family protein [Planctomycetota bacterium]|nr:TlpA disulfide reductase family protein [Planctomycetota bacterium]
MKKTLTIVMTVLCLTGLTVPVIAQDAKLDAAALKAKSQEVLKSAGGKARSGKKAVADFADDIKKIDDAVANAADPKSPGAAQLQLLKAQILMICKDKSTVTVLDAILKDHQTGPWAERATMVKAQYLAQAGDTDGLKALKEAAEKAKMDKRVVGQIQGMMASAALAVGKEFPDFKVKDTEGKELSLSEYKGKVVLVDFWATWCGPCMKEMPNVIKAYTKYHAKGFEIIGISFDKDKDRMDKVTKDKKMTWRQYFDGKGWGNLLGKKYGIRSIPATFLVGKDGKIIAKNLRGDDLEKALAKAYGDK